MRKLGAVSVVFVVACGSSPESSSSSSSRPPPPAKPEPVAKPAPVAGKLVDTSKDEVDAVTMRYAGKGVSLAELPMVADKIGLPVSGTADFSIDIVVPKVKGARDYSQASGRIELACTKCQIGDDVAKLQVAPKRATEFADGIPFGHISIDRFETTLEITSGLLEVTSWKVSSPDLDIQARLAVTFVQSLEASALGGCLRFKPTETLAKRDARTHGMIMMTGAQRGEDGFHQIALGGTVGEVRKLARECTASL